MTGDANSGILSHMQGWPLRLAGIWPRKGKHDRPTNTGAMKLRTRLENSDTLAAILSWILAGYLRFCFATTRWRVEGLEDLSKALQDGSVIYVLWHSKTMYGPLAWPYDLARLFALHDPSPIGRIGSRTQARLGMVPVAMQANSSNFAASRQVLKTIRAGHSIGIAADGPKGPARDAKKSTIEWARASGRPVFLFSWQSSRTLQLNTWDKMVLPMPFAKGVYGFCKWDTAVPRKLDDAGYRALTRSLSAALDQITTDIDRSAGVVPDN